MRGISKTKKLRNQHNHLSNKINIKIFYPKVSTEAPKFKTVAADAVMNVVQPPTSTPRYTVFVLIEV